jgi:p-hydroxybenzoate 3-monooxygenase
MNLALADAAIFVEGIRAFYEHDDETLLASYSQRCLQRVWHAQEFSHWLLHVIHAPTPDQQEAEFMRRLQLARLDRLRTSTATAASFAEDYIGCDLDLAFP